MSRKNLVISAAALMIGTFFAAKEVNTPAIHAAKNLLAGVFFVDSITESDLKNTYTKAKNGGKKMRVIVVPGHDDESWGAQFHGVKEADLNREAGEILADLLNRDDAFEVFLTRDRNGYTEKFSSYFASNRQAIQEFTKKNIEAVKNAVRSGIIERHIGVKHNFAPQEAGLRLHGINKWANENGVSLLIHIHFNDETKHLPERPGEYSGFAVYVPERQFSNAKASRTVAESLLRQLNRYFHTSNLPKESTGIVEDQDLIAIGSGNSLDAASVLIEYGYIYEKQFIDPRIRPAIVQELATQTYFGIKQFFEPELAREYRTTLLPFLWQENLTQGTKNKEVLALQAALIHEGLYPPLSRTKNDCPMNGNFGPCTAAAVKKFQEKYTIEPAGIVGPLTRKTLNKIYGSPTASR